MGGEIGFSPFVDVEMGAGNDKVAFDAIPMGFKAGLAAPESGGEMAPASLVSSPSPTTFFLIKPMIPVLLLGEAVVDDVFSVSAFSRVGFIISCAARNTVSIT